MSTISKRVSYLVETKANGVVVQFAQKVGVNDQNIRNILNRSRNNPSYDLIVKILEAYQDINPEWFVLGKGNPLRETTEDPCNSIDMLLKRYEELIIENKELRDQVSMLLEQKKGHNESSHGILNPELESTEL